MGQVGTSWDKLGHVRTSWDELGRVGTSWDESGTREITKFDIKKNVSRRKKKNIGYRVASNERRLIIILKDFLKFRF